MTRKFYFVALMAVALFVSSSSAVFAQTAPIAGKVEMVQADGTRVPVADAKVDLYRTDIKQNKPLTAETNKQGKFVFAGAMLGATFAVAASAPNAAPSFLLNIRPGTENVVITLLPGDGKRLTAADLTAPPQSSSSSSTASTTGTTTTGGDAKKVSEAEQKKLDEEFAKKTAEVQAKNAKIQNAQKVIQAASEEGRRAFTAKNWDLAIAKFDEAYQADPDYWGTAPVFLMNKADALRSRGVDKYNTALKIKEPAARTSGMNDAKKDFQDSVDALQRALDIFAKTETSADKPTEAAQVKNLETNKFAVLEDRAESYRLLVKTDNSKGADGLKAYQEYLAVEVDPAKKSKAQMVAADMAMEAGDLQLAVDEFRKIVAADPSNAKATYKLGISLIGLAANNNDKALYQEGVNTLQKFADSAPDTDPDKAYAVATIEQMKAEQNVAPQKGGRATGGNTKRKN